MTKITKAMVDRAMAYHERTETLRSLNKANALAYLYYKQQGNKAATREYGKIVNRREEVKAMVQKLQSRRPVTRKRVVRRATSSSIWKPTHKW